MAWLLKNWQGIGAGSLLVLVIGFLAHTIAMKSLEASYVDKLATQEKELTDQCEDAKAVTEEVSRELQNKLAMSNGALSDARRLLNKRCAAPVVVNTSPRHDGEASTGELRLQNGDSLEADANQLFDIAGEAEEVRVRLIACQTFVERSRGLRVNE